MGCGGSERPASDDQPSAAARPAADATATVQRWVDDDDCAVVTDSYTDSSYPEASDARTACEKDTTEGLCAGEYKVKSSRVDGTNATVVLALNASGTRTYKLVKQGNRWLVDDVSEQTAPQRGKLGDTLHYSESYELNGEPIDARLAITLLSLKRAKAPEYYPTKRGHRWLRTRARVMSDSSDELLLTTPDFLAVDAEGQRYPASGGPFTPSLEAATLSPGDTLTGYAGFELPTGARIIEVRYLPAGSTGSPLVWTADGSP